MIGWVGLADREEEFVNAINHLWYFFEGIFSWLFGSKRSPKAKVPQNIKNEIGRPTSHIFGFGPIIASAFNEKFAPTINMLDDENLRRAHCLFRKNIIQDSSFPRMVCRIDDGPCIELIMFRWPRMIEAPLLDIGFGAVYGLMGSW